MSEDYKPLLHNSMNFRLSNEEKDHLEKITHLTQSKNDSEALRKMIEFIYTILILYKKFTLKTIGEILPQYDLNLKK